ncbi:MAG: hypothetical protein SPL15_04340 [Lachnospiraceae bacterium]|nr:hypothetical protein [Lachnospiraceae bacterium]
MAIKKWKLNLQTSSFKQVITIQSKFIFPNGFPTTELYYIFNGTIVAEVDVNANAGISAELLGAGFTASGTIGSTMYFRRPFNSTGVIQLYH